MLAVYFQGWLVNRSANLECNLHLFCHSAWALALQRHLRVLTKFVHVESWLSGRYRPTEVVFYTPLNLCDRRACSASVAVGLDTFIPHKNADFFKAAV